MHTWLLQVSNSYVCCAIQATFFFPRLHSVPLSSYVVLLSTPPSTLLTQVLSIPPFIRPLGKSVLRQSHAPAHPLGLIIPRKVHENSGSKPPSKNGGFCFPPPKTAKVFETTLFIFKNWVVPLSLQMTFSNPFPAFISLFALPFSFLFKVFFSFLSKFLPTISPLCFDNHISMITIYHKPKKVFLKKWSNVAFFFFWKKRPKKKLEVIFASPNWLASNICFQSESGSARFPIYFPEVGCGYTGIGLPSKHLNWFVQDSHGRCVKCSAPMKKCGFWRDVNGNRMQTQLLHNTKFA